MGTLARIAVPHSGHYDIIENVDDISTTDGVLNILYGIDSEKGPRRTVYAPGQWEKLMVETVPDTE